jgi:thioredoxin-like negative regulator of GroEL
MESVTFADDRIVSATRDFVPLKVDADANEIFAETYRADILPTTLLLDAGGEEIARFTGFVGPDDLLETLDKVRDGYAEYLDQVSRRRDPIALEAAASFLQEVGNDNRAVDLFKRALKSLKGADPEDFGRIELKLARSHLSEGDPGAAAKILERLSSEGASETIRGRALQGLVIAQQQRGRTAESSEALDRLRRDFPAMAEELMEGS